MVNTIIIPVRHFYPRPPRGGRQRCYLRRCYRLYFYPRPPRGGRPIPDESALLTDEFLSTPSARRATFCLSHNCTFSTHFYPRPPRGGRPCSEKENLKKARISIHALREEGDGKFRVRGAVRKHFYPRPPRGGRRQRSANSRSTTRISIHALREEGDPKEKKDLTATKNFYPRPPRGGRRTARWKANESKAFLSTPSARRATAKTERKPSAFVSLYTSLHKLQRGACKTNRKITPLLAQTAGIPVRSVWENHVRCLFALAGHQKISTLSCANSGCSPTCSTLVW